VRSYNIVPVGPGSLLYSRCPDCAALVFRGDQSTHDYWHDEVLRVIATGNGE
jgi:hypothetical protein